MKIILVLLFLVLISCKKIEETQIYTVNPNINAYLEQFNSIANQYYYEYSYNNLEISPEQRKG